MAATSFIVFAMPKAISAQTKNVLGGHLIGIIIGTIFYYTPFTYYLEYPLVVGIAFFLMVVLDLEHPPAAGTALAVVIHEVSIDIFPTIMIAALLLTQCRYYLRRHLKNLI